MKTSDSVLNITIANDISSLVFQPTDWSVINIPIDREKADILADNLFNTPSFRHVTLILNRHRRKDRVKGLSAISAFDNKNWKFMESINIAYGKPTTCSNNGFLPVAEQGYLFYKGDAPDTKRTAWASSGEYQNATNDWSLFARPVEDKLYKHTYYQRFSWELQLLMMSLVGYGEHNRFLYSYVDSTFSPQDAQSIYLFCLKNRVSVDIILKDVKSGELFLEYIDNINPNIKNEVLRI